MAKAKQSLKHYQLDTDRYADERITSLISALGCKGIAVYDYLLCMCYREGSILVWDFGTAADASLALNLSVNAVQEVVRYCAAVGLFSKALLSRGIITSAAIQRRFIRIARQSKRRPPSIPPQYNLLEGPAAQPAAIVTEQVNNGDLTEQAAAALDAEISQMSDDMVWLDAIQCMHHMSVEQLRTELAAFRLQCISDGKLKHQDLPDAKRHFNNWLRVTIQKRNNVNIRQKQEDRRRAVLLSDDEKKVYGSSF